MSIWKGVVAGIYTTALAEHLPIAVESVSAVPGRGLVGDRYYNGTGTYSKKPGYGGREVTLIECEVLDLLVSGRNNAQGDQYNIHISAAESRRNIATRGVPLGHLIAKRFWVGSVLLLGTRICEPCLHLERLTQARVMEALTHRGGLRATIESAGLITVGDVIRPADET